MQRLDRLNAANSYESRTPFLDARVMDFSLKIPIQYKIHGEEQTGKRLLRQAFEGCLTVEPLISYTIILTVTIKRVIIPLT